MREGWIERVKVEKAELSERVTKLQAFVRSAHMSALGEDEKLRLRQQLYYMVGYELVLIERLQAVGEEREQAQKHVRRPS